MKEINEKLVEKPYYDDVNFDEAIPMQIIKEKTTEAYKDNKDQDIKFVEKFLIEIRFTSAKIDVNPI